MSTELTTRPRQTLDQRLRAFRRRMLAIGIVSLAGWAAVAAVVAWLAFAWIDLLWELSGSLRLGFNGAALALATGVAVAGLAVWLVRARLESVARRVDQVGDALGEVVSGYDLSSSPTRGSALTQGLTRMAVTRASAIAGSVPAERAVPWRPLWAAAIAMLATAAVVAAVAVLFPALARSQWLRFVDPFGDHPPYSRVAFDVQPGNTRVLYGAALDVFVTTTGPAVEQVELVVQPAGKTDDEVLPMFREPDGRWRTVLARVTEDAKYFARARRSRSHRYDLGVIMVPRLASVRFRVTAPAYTRLPPYEGPLPAGGLVGLKGTQVQLWAHSNRPLSGGRLTISSGDESEAIDLKPISDGGSEVTGAFEIRAAGKFELGVTDAAGYDSRDKLSGTIVLATDESPFVRITSPPATSLATPTATLPVNVSGEDDYGVSRLQLYRSLNDSRGLALDFDIPEAALARVDASEALPLSAYGLAAGDVIKLFARVEDNDPAGAKGAESPVVTVHIISQEDYERMVRVRQGLEVLLSKYRQADRRMESVAEELRGLRKKLQGKKGDTENEALAQALKKLAQRMRRESQQLRKAANHRLPLDLDAHLLEKLQELADQLARQAGDLEDLASGEELDPEEAMKLLEKLLEELGKEKQQFARQVLEPLEHLEQVYPLIEDQARFIALYELERDLAERSRSLAADGSDDPRQKARMRTLEEEQRTVREALSELLDDIENHASRLPDDPRLDELRATALTFCDEVRASGASEKMSDAEAALVAFNGADAHTSAREAADILEKFISRCRAVKGQGKMCLKFAPALEAGLGATIEQLLAEMGLPTDGTSGDGRNGYSTRRSTLDNMGLFGQLPGMDQMAGAFSQRGGEADGSGATRPGGSNNISGVDASGNAVEAGGAAGTVVPPRYRNRVGAYFQRVVEEGQPR